MNEENKINEIKAKGYDPVYVWEEKSGEEEIDHQHPFDTYLYILSGEISIKVGESVERLLKTGDTAEVLRNTVHSAKAGPSGCKYIVGERS